MDRRTIGNKHIDLIIDAINKSDKKDEILNYIAEVTKKCADLCKVGEGVRVFNEYKILFNNVVKELNL